MTSPGITTQALGLILKGPEQIENPGIVLLDYHDTATYASLWLNGLKSGKLQIHEQEIDLTDSTKQFLIIGNDPPDGIYDTRIPGLQSINFRSHFTATSWLAAWKVKFSPTQKEKEEDKAVEANTRIAVIDPRPTGMGQGAARALQTIFGARNASNSPLVPNATVLNEPSLTEICQWLKPIKPDTRTVNDNTPHIRELLKSTIWSELTSNREQHHALSNVLGAFLLSAQVGSGVPHPGDPWIQDYLLALVNACGFMAHTEQVSLQQADRESGPHQVWISKDQQNVIPGAVLIDDMADLWNRFVAGALGFYGRQRDRFAVLGRGNFNEAIQALPSRLAAHFDSRVAHISASALLAIESKVGDDFVLFLDLRLFSQTKGKVGETEDVFFQNLSDFGLKLLASKRNLPWLNEEEKDAMRLELETIIKAEGCSEGGRLPPLETLLPRIISLLDPTLPVVIFSSTHRTELIEPFRNYGNIITGFHKPVLSGLSDGWESAVNDMHRDFLEAMDRATAVLRVRRLLRPFQKPLLAN